MTNVMYNNLERYYTTPHDDIKSFWKFRHFFVYPAPNMVLKNKKNMLQYKVLLCFALYLQEEDKTMAKKQFKTESKRILDLMINSIYTHPEIFLREIISNASDAIDKLCYLSLTDDKVGMSREDFRIKITFSEPDRIITVSDNGIGMDEKDLENNLGVIARSGSLNFKKEMEKAGEASDLEIIGQFGVGFYSAFMVADKVTVISKKYGSDTAYKWESNGADGYTIEETEKDGVGTDVIMHIKEDAHESEYTRFLNDMSIGQLIKRYSDFVRWPIIMDGARPVEVDSGEKDEDGNPVMKTEYEPCEEIINSMVPIWQRPKEEVAQEEIDDFYKNAFFDTEGPVSTIRINAEGQVSYKAMLFIPAKAPFNFYSEEFDPGLQLYCNGVKIMDNCKAIIPDCFRFVRGVVESPDFSLNLSREVLQESRQLKLICNNFEKKIKNELIRLMDEEPDEYNKFYASFSSQLKYSAVANWGEKKDLLVDLLEFYSSTEKELVPLREYRKKMPEDQPFIYYVCSDSITQAENLPQTEQVRDKGYEILYLTDDVDDFVIRKYEEYDGKKLCDVSIDDLGIETDEDKAEIERKSEESKELFDYIKETLGDEITDVRYSPKLKSHPVYLTSGSDVTIEMEKYFSMMPNNEQAKGIKAQKVLELNPEHPAVKTLDSCYKTDKDRAGKLCYILLCQARLIANLPLTDPAKYTELVCELF